MASLFLVLLAAFVALVQNSPTGGCFYAGEYRAVGEFTLQEHFRCRCYSDGIVQDLGCITDQGLIPFQSDGQTIVIGQFRYECVKNGTQFYYQRSFVQTEPEGPTGCYLGGQKYELGEEFLLVDRFSYKCSSAGVAVFLGCKSDTDGLIAVQELGGSLVKGHFKYECYKNGTAPHYRRSVIEQW